uniref:Preprotein translocase subunit SecY n=1 Tax=Thaumasiovibrio occultus TaxID=1891184 RepID=UPI0018642067|nr:Preprotein translocase subunit SecY [Thaumasiovibrio occultus]
MTAHPYQRRPKSAISLAVAYAFTGASILASIIFSLLLFLSLDDNMEMKLLFGSLAVIFELGKFYAWYEFGERWALRNISGSLVALTFYTVLAIISIGGSIGGINSATNTITQQVAVSESRTDSFNRQIAMLEDQLALNEAAAQRYIEMDRIATGLARIQKENRQLQADIQQLEIERDNLPVQSQGSILGLIDGLAQSLGTTFNNAKLSVVIFLALLLDLFAAFFVSLLGEEMRFRYFHKHQLAMGGHSARGRDVLEAPQRLHSNSNAPFADEKNESGEIREEENDEPKAEPLAANALMQQVIHLLQNDQLPCQKKAVANHFALAPEQVDSIFRALMTKGLVEQKPNHHFQWVSA